MSARRPTARGDAAVLDDAHHAGAAQAAVHRDAPVGELGGDQVGGALLLEAQFGVGVDVAPQRGDGCRLGDDGVQEFHGGMRGPAGNPALRCPTAAGDIRENAAWPSFSRPRASTWHPGRLQHRRRQLEPGADPLIRDELARLGVSRLSYNADAQGQPVRHLGEGSRPASSCRATPTRCPGTGRTGRWTRWALVRDGACTAAGSADMKGFIATAVAHAELFLDSRRRSPSTWPSATTRRSAASA